MPHTAHLALSCRSAHRASHSHCGHLLCKLLHAHSAVVCAAFVCMPHTAHLALSCRNAHRASHSPCGHWLR
eukprot:3720051-Pleurochrysis_carterae.AAC.1